MFQIKNNFENIKKSFFNLLEFFEHWIENILDQKNV